MSENFSVKMGIIKSSYQLSQVYKQLESVAVKLCGTELFDLTEKLIDAMQDLVDAELALTKLLQED